MGRYIRVRDGGVRVYFGGAGWYQRSTLYAFLLLSVETETTELE